MSRTYSSPEVIIMLILTLGSLIWGIRLWTTPSIYNPESIFYRKIYFWYSAWTNRPVDESFALDEREVVIIGKAITGLSSLILIMILLLLLI